MVTMATTQTIILPIPIAVVANKVPGDQAQLCPVALGNGQGLTASVEENTMKDIRDSKEGVALEGGGAGEDPFPHGEEVGLMHAIYIYGAVWRYETDVESTIV